MTTTRDEEVAQVIELERRLLEPGVRVSCEALTALLHEDFREFGESGRSYDRDSMIQALVASDGATANAFDFEAIHLSSDVVLLTYRTDSPSLRTSIWSRAPGGAWRLLHHQGTRAAGRPTAQAGWGS